MRKIFKTGSENACADVFMLKNLQNARARVFIEVSAKFNCCKDKTTYASGCVGVARMGHRRGEIQILMDVLTTCLNAVKVTHIMYRANLSYSTLRKYLLKSLDEGLISIVRGSDGSVEYRTTEKGRLLLGKLKEVKSALSS
jgi:predicted transcriptional regulator